MGASPGPSEDPSVLTRRVAFVTYEGLPQLSDDDRRAIGPLREKGVEAVPVRWDDREVDWSSFELILLRSTWDYYRKYAEFLRWIERPEIEGRLCNSREIVRWNSHKQYLLELADRGLPVVPTRLVRRGEGSSLRSILEETGWSPFVVKPAVSASGDGFFRAERSQIPGAERHLERLLERGDALIQPFANRIEATGERSYVFFDGAFSHAAEYPALLRTSDRDARLLEPDPTQLASVSRVLPSLGMQPLYARIDLIPDDAQGWWLGELELIEPELLFRVDPSSCERFADAVAQKLQDSRLGLGDPEGRATDPSPPGTGR